MADPLILALDQGTTSTRAILFDAKGRALAEAGRPLEQFYPADGWVEHDAEESFETSRRRPARGAGQVRPRDRGRRRHRHHQPARDGGDLGQGHRQARSTAPSSGRTAAPPPTCERLRAAGRGGAGHRHHRPAARSLFLRHARSPGCWARSRARAPRAGRRTAGRHHRQLGDLEAHRRGVPRHRRHQRLAHPAVRPARTRPGRPRCWRCWTSPGLAARRCSIAPRDFGDTCSRNCWAGPSRSAAWPATSRRR